MEFHLYKFLYFFCILHLLNQLKCAQNLLLEKSDDSMQGQLPEINQINNSSPSQHNYWLSIPIHKNVNFIHCKRWMVFWIPAVRNKCHFISTDDLSRLLVGCQKKSELTSSAILHSEAVSHFFPSHCRQQLFGMLSPSDKFPPRKTRTMDIWSDWIKIVVKCRN